MTDYGDYGDALLNPLFGSGNLGVYEGVTVISVVPLLAPNRAQRLLLVMVSFGMVPECCQGRPEGAGFAGL